MPIKGLTDRQAAFPEIGRIRKGAPKTEEGYVGKDLSHFRVEFDEKEKEATIVFRSVYGDKPTELNILLPFNSVEENFEAWREAYVAGGLVHRCDGENVIYEIDPDTGEQTVVNGQPERKCDRSRNCKPVGRLKILIPELQRLAFLTVLTSSFHDIMNISRQLQAILQINGKLAGVPLKLRRRPMLISTPSGPDGKRARRLKSLLSIEADPEWVRMKLIEMKNAALPGNGFDEDEYPQLEAPEVIDLDESDFSEEEDDYFPDDFPPQNEKVQKINTNGKRPYPPHIVRERIHDFIEDFKGERKDQSRPGGTLVTFMAWQMNELFPGDPKPDGKRIAVLNYLFERKIESTNDLTGAELRAIERWIEPKEWEGPGSGSTPRKEAKMEAASIFTTYMKEKGQQELIDE